MPSHSNQSAQELLTEFLDEASDKSDTAFKAFCANHPEEAEELRRLYGVHHEIQQGFSMFGRGRIAIEQESYSESARVGDMIGDFKLVSRIASGGQGEVWVAEQQSLQRRVALKLVLPDRISEKTLALFAREARAGGRLAHPGIVTVYGYGKDGGRHWIAQELVDGAWTLRDFIDMVRKEEKLPENYYRIVARFVAELADALQAAHDAGVLHRDVKPQNVLVTPDDHPKLTDFGLARITGEVAVSMTGDFAGTWLYMSPEQVTAKRIEIDHRTDIFSLGVVMYEILALQRPFDGDTTHQIAENIVLRDPPDLRKLKSRVPSDLAVICAKALEKLRDCRFQSMGELSADIRRYLAHKPIHARSASPILRMIRWGRRHPAWAVVVSAAVLVVLVASIGAIKLANSNANLREEKVRTEDARLRAVANGDLANEERVRAEGALDKSSRRSYWGFLQAAKAAIEDSRISDAGKLLEACRDDLRGWEWDHLSLRMDSSSRAYEQGGRVVDVEWGPMGLRLASANSRGDVTILRAEDGKELLALDVGGSYVRDLTWSPNGALLAAGFSDGTLRLWDIPRGGILKGTPHHEGEVSSVEWSPSGDHLAVGGEDGSIEIWQVATWSKLDLLGHSRAIEDLGWSPDGDRLISADGASVRIWSRVSGLELAVLKSANQWRVDAVAWSPDGSRLASSSKKGVTRIWNADNFREEAALYGKSGPVNDVGWTSDGLRIVTGTRSGVVRIWDAINYVGIATLKGHSELVTRVTWSRDGKSLASASRDGTIRIWDGAGSNALSTLSHGLEELYDVSWSPDGSRISCVSSHNLRRELRLWRASNGRLITVLRDFESTIDSMEWDPIGAYFATVGKGETVVRLWAGIDGAKAGVLVGHEKGVTDISWNGDGTRLATTSSDRSVRIWDVSGETLPGILNGHVSSVKCVEWSPGSDRIASGGSDGSLRVWSADDGSEIQVLSGHTASINAIAWSLDGRYLASTSSDGTTRLWTLDNGTSVVVVTGVRTPLALLAVSPDGSSFASTVQKGVALVWDAKTGIVQTALRGGDSTIQKLIWSPDSLRIATSDYNSDLRLWAIPGGEELSVFTGSDIAWSPDGAQLSNGYRVFHSELEDAIAWANVARARQSAEYLLDSLFREFVFQRRVIEELKLNSTVGADVRDIAIHLASLREDPLEIDFHEIFEMPVSFDGVRNSQLRRDLGTIRIAIDREPKNALLRGLLSQELSRLGRLRDAVRQAAIAVDVSDEEARPRFQKHLESLRGMYRAMDRKGD